MSGGAADQDGTVLTGDEILAVNGESVVGASHHRVVTLMAEAGNKGVVTLLLCRRQGMQLYKTTMVKIFFSILIQFITSWTKKIKSLYKFISVKDASIYFFLWLMVTSP